jgi:hypothetical protein
VRGLICRCVDQTDSLGYGVWLSFWFGVVYRDTEIVFGGATHVGLGALIEDLLSILGSELTSAYPANHRVPSKRSSPTRPALTMFHPFVHRGSNIFQPPSPQTNPVMSRGKLPI